MRQSDASEAVRDIARRTGEAQILQALIPRGSLCLVMVNALVACQRWPGADLQEFFSVLIGSSYGYACAL